MAKHITTHAPPALSAAEYKHKGRKTALGVILAGLKSFFTRKPKAKDDVKIEDRNDLLLRRPAGAVCAITLDYGKTWRYWPEAA